MFNPQAQTRNIYLADDDADDRILFEDALREVTMNVQLTVADDGQDLMQILDSCVPPPPEVIFLDINMPRKNGFECLEEIRHTQKLKDIPVVIFSTTSQEQVIQKAYANGANRYIQKPGTFQQLKDIIQKVLAIDWNKSRQQPIHSFIINTENKN